MFRVKSLVVPAILLMVAPGLIYAARMEQPELGDACGLAECDEVDEVDHGQGDPDNSFYCSYAPWDNTDGDVEFAPRQDLFDCTEAGYENGLDGDDWTVQQLSSFGVPYGVEILPTDPNAPDLDSICVNEQNPTVMITRLTVDRDDLIAKFAMVTENPSWFGSFDITLNGQDFSIPVVYAWGNPQRLNELIVNDIRFAGFQVAESDDYIRVTADPLGNGIHEIRIDTGENTGLTATGVSLEPSNAFNFQWCFPPQMLP